MSIEMSNLLQDAFTSDQADQDQQMIELGDEFLAMVSGGAAVGAETTS